MFRQHTWAGTRQWIHIYIYIKCQSRVQAELSHRAETRRDLLAGFQSHTHLNVVKFKSAIRVELQYRTCPNPSQSVLICDRGWYSFTAHRSVETWHRPASHNSLKVLTWPWTSRHCRARFLHRLWPLTRFLQVSQFSGPLQLGSCQVVILM